MTDRLPPGDDDDDDIDSLGAAPTNAVPESKKTRRKRSGVAARMRGRSPRAWVIVIAVIIALAFVPVTVSGFKKTPRNMVGISYGGGPFESAHFQRIVMPGSGLFFNGFFDPLYLYPADTQAYIVSKTVGQGAVKQPDSIIAPSKDRVPIEYQIAVYFKLNIDRLRQFHESLGLQYSAYTSAGWKSLIQDTFRQQIENALQEETRQYDVADLYGNADVLKKVQDDVESNLSQRLVSSIGDSFFCGPTYVRGGTCGEPQFIIKKIDVPDSVVQAFQDNRTSQIQVQTAQNQIAQRQAEAQAIEALNAGLAQGGMNYVLLKAIESGKITFWVLPNDSGLTLTAPADGSAPGVPTTTTTTTTPSK